MGSAMRTAPYSPTTTGKVERLHKTLREEFFSEHTVETITEAQTGQIGGCPSARDPRPYRNGFDDLAQVALADSVLARTSDDSAEAIPAAVRGVELARKSPEKIMLTYATEVDLHPVSMGIPNIVSTRMNGLPSGSALPLEQLAEFEKVPVGVAKEAADFATPVLDQWWGEECRAELYQGVVCGLAVGDTECELGADGLRVRWWREADVGFVWCWTATADQE